MGLAHSHSHRLDHDSLERDAGGKAVAAFAHPALTADRISAAPGFSLLRLSAFARLGGALALVAALWALVYWALH
ncbi:MAG: hypothetical protein ACLPSF_14085 [Methylocella sp.]